ncbi:ABC transporter ATP-binding protein [Verrucomicrobium spinosum]|uniref:ABC transporter ATP-binding protein n=1 Tax=Verrucomicrobium spinosum TaxID=2736 RepID=UPI0001745360|nr:ABC transporter ATP-binding protein [Verrucomicrobium spinosum]
MTLIPPENLEKFTQAPASLELYRITKKFGDFTAADEISLTVPPGTVHALLGENGAGKSTLVKCVMGFHPATSGEIMVGGHVREVQHPSDARKYGIGMVYQHFTLVPSMTVTENLVLSRPDVPAAVNWKKETARLEEFMATEAPFKVPLHKRASELAAGEKQKTEILKQLYLKSRILILDEPTSVLTPAEATEVLALLRQMTVAGKLSIIIITHKFREVFSFADDVTVLRRGRLAGQGKVRELDRDALAAMMMGDASEAKPAPSAPQATTPATSRRTALRVKQLSVLGDNGLIAVKEVSFELGEGEVLGIAGVAGNGQRELMEVLGGQRPAASGSLEAHGQPYQGTRRDILAHQFHTLPEEPLRNACAPMLSVAENIALRTFDQPPQARWKWLLNFRAVRKSALPLIEDYSIKTRGPDTPIRDLSGGNVQRAILARELSTRPLKILVVSEPCFGLDFAATDFVHQKITEARDRGVAVLVVSSDLDELLKITDRLLVMSGGQITYETPTATADLAVIGTHMAGH